MSDNKRYYWFKLKEDFFNEKRMKRLRKLSAGSTYTIVYLKLLLLSLRDDGKLYFEKVDETFAKELALIIDENEDDILITLQYLQKVELLQVLSEDEFFSYRITEFNRHRNSLYKTFKKIKGTKSVAMQH